MAPKIQVPADFGRNHIGAPAHGNLVFKLKDGEEVRANSMILSLNSPVIDHLTTELHQQTLEADDFQRDAVDCFIEAAYTGELENLTKANFRDVNKMSQVFDVSWLSERCAVYFEALVAELSEESKYEEILFVVEEARVVLKSLKQGAFLELVIKTMSPLLTVQRITFIKQYMVGFTEFPKDRLDVAIKTVQRDVFVLVEIVTEYLGANKQSIGENTWHLIENIDLSLCENAVTDALFQVLDDIETVSKEDFKRSLNIFKQDLTKRSVATGSKDPNCATDIPNMFLSFEKYINMDSFEDVLNDMAVSEKVVNLYMLFDGLWTWLIQHYRHGLKFDDGLILKQLIRIKNDRNWGVMAYSYLDKMGARTYMKLFVDMIKECKELVSLDKEGFAMFCSKEFSMDGFADFLFCNSIRFNRTDEPATKCLQKGTCGVILQTTSPVPPEKFSIRLNEDPSYYPPGLHFHKDQCNPANMHLALMLRGKIVPLTWCWKPLCNNDGEEWEWGFWGFHSRQYKRKQITTDSLLNWKATLYDYPQLVLLTN